MWFSVVGRPFSTICAHVGRGLEREGWGAAMGGGLRSLGGGGRGNPHHKRVAFSGLNAIMLLLL